MSESAYAAAMRHALELAERGPAHDLNPRVGCVILDDDGATLAVGWHRGVGTPHAEVDALSRLSADDARGSTAVVTLEPCNHLGRTGPCAEALITAGVRRVVYAVADPGAASGGGAETLRRAGVDVVPGVLADQGTELLADWLATAALGRPLVTLKWASSLDGRTAAADGSSRWITGASARADVHERRAGSDAILVGTGTALADDPSLTARDADGRLLETQPVPVVLGERSLPASAAIFSHPRAPIVCAHRDVAAALSDLRRRGIRRLFVEGGPTVADAFVRAGFVDEVVAYLAPVLLGGPRTAIGDIGVDSLDAARRLRTTEVRRLGDDVLIVAEPIGGGAPLASMIRQRQEA